MVRQPLANAKRLPGIINRTIGYRKDLGRSINRNAWTPFADAEPDYRASVVFPDADHFCRQCGISARILHTSYVSFQLVHLSPTRISYRRAAIGREPREASSPRREIYFCGAASLVVPWNRRLRHYALLYVVLVLGLRAMR